MKTKEQFISFYKALNRSILLSKDGIIWEESPFKDADIKKAAFWAHLYSTAKGKSLGNFELFR